MDIFDTLLASQLVSAGDIEERHGLEAVAGRYLNETVDKTQRLSDWDFELSEAQLEYAARDAAVLLPLRERLIERLKAESLVKVAQLEFECVMTVVDIELAGFFMHKDRWLDQLAIVEKRRTELAGTVTASSRGRVIARLTLWRPTTRGHQPGFASTVDAGIKSTGHSGSGFNEELEDATFSWAVSGHWDVARVPNGAKGVDELWREYDRIDQSVDETFARGFSSDWCAHGKIRVYEPKHSAGAPCG